MTKKLRNIAALGALAVVLSLGARAAAEAQAVVLHISSDPTVPALDVRRALDIVRQIYRQAGADVEWTLENRADDQRQRHFEVLVLSEARTEHKCLMDSLEETVFGSAARPTGRAFVFYARVAEFAGRRHSSASRLLGVIIAHEVGHLLLPPGHAASGLMRADLPTPVAHLPQFTADEARTIHARLAAPEVQAN